MRIPSVLLLPATAACLALALTGCSGGSTGGGGAPSASSAAAASAVDLAGTTWRVSDADDATSGTTAHFDGSAVTVTAGGGSSSYAWSAQGDQVLVGGGTSGLAGAAPAEWLTRTARVQRDGDGWVLLAADGSRTARLTAAGGSASPAPTTPVSLLQSGTPGPGVGATTAKALEGRWTVAGAPTSAIVFEAGQWQATSSCATGALGGRGVYRVLPGGRLLVVRTATPIRGCPIVQGVPRLRPNAITAIARAASFRVRGDTLQLFDRTGTGLGALVRG
ncbi:hypothetical protein GCM10025783_02340 [Amnibacterium soli]|uniref:META domain-containing protein n=1 Tax=Amnibacterium soli TaxID=1282736 RepID=A0ABP8YRD6_9MICO